MNYTWYEMGWIVLIYSFLGWCAEVAFAAVRHGRFVNRGFLNGPVCPIYGYGVLCVLLILEPVKSNLVLLFFGSMFFTSAIEFLVGFIMEQLFHDKWWDYSNNPFNIKGYVCLEFSIIWGIACVLVVDVIHPMIYALIKKLSTPVGIWVMAALLALLVFDAILTLAEMLKLNKRFKAITELECAIHSVSDAMGEKLIYEPMERGKERRVAFDEKHPEFAEKKREAVEDVMAKRSDKRGCEGARRCTPRGTGREEGRAGGKARRAQEDELHPRAYRGGVPAPVRGRAQRRELPQAARLY